MKSILFLVVIALFFTFTTNAQITTTTAESVKNQAYKIILQYTGSDTLEQMSLIRHINNALNAAPKSQIEVVCHSGGISFLQVSKTQYAATIKTLQDKGVLFAACENSMRSRNIPKTDIVPGVAFVPAGVIEIVDKESKGWSYLKN